MEAGKIVVKVERTFPLEAARMAQEMSEAGRVRGKLVLTVDQAIPTLG